MRASRLLSILLLLQTRGRLTAQTLAAIFEVSVRTIYRDVDQLSAAGVPVYADRGPGGGFELLDGYRTRLTGLTEGEAGALPLAGLPGPAADLGLGDALAGAQLELLAALPDAGRAGASRVQGRFHLDPVGWFADQDPAPHLQALADAVWGARRIAVTYGRRRAVELTLAPLGLVLKAGVWYLVAEAGEIGGKGAPRTYRVSQITRVATSGDVFDRPIGFDLAAHWRRSSQAYEAALQTDTAELRADASGLEGLARISRIVAEAVAASTLPEGRAGWFRVRVPIESPDHALRAFLALGASIEVLSPLALRARVKQAASDILGLYGAEG